MDSPQRWFERKFDVSLPNEMLPNIVTRLRGTPARLEETILGVAHDVLTSKEACKWSAQEHAGHLMDLEPLWISRLDDFVNGSAEMKPADLTNRKTNEANHNARPPEEILADFRAVRGLFLERIEKADPAAFDHTLAHPRLKSPMRLLDLLYFVAEHDDHHLAQIWFLLHSSSRSA